MKTKGFRVNQDKIQNDSPLRMLRTCCKFYNLPQIHYT